MTKDEDQNKAAMEQRFDEFLKNNAMVAVTVRTDDAGIVEQTLYIDDEYGGDIRKNVKSFIHSERSVLIKEFLFDLRGFRERYERGLHTGVYTEDLISKWRTK